MKGHTRVVVKAKVYAVRMLQASNGDRMNYTLYDSSSEKVAVLLPGFVCVSAHYTFDTLAKELGI